MPAICGDLAELLLRQPKRGAEAVRRRQSDDVGRKIDAQLHLKSRDRVDDPQRRIAAPLSPSAPDRPRQGHVELI